MRAALAITLLVAGCYSPKLTDGQFTCANGGSCPIGFSCNACGVCTSSGTSSCDMAGGGPPGDMSRPGDGGMMGSSPCSNGGMRAMGDPGLPSVALCPAAWATAGLLTAPSCNRQPTGNGKSASGTACAAADNCAAGFHICRDQSDLTTHGFTAAACNALASQQALYVTAQPGEPPMPPTTGPPLCSGSVEHAVFGCGGFGGGVDTSTCTVENHSLVDKPNDGVDDCSNMTGGAFSCGPTGVSQGTFEINVVTKASLAGGGVICCAD